jgi:hypothetical protein
VLIAKLAISTVFDSRSAEFLERWPRAIGASACRAGVEARPAMEGALQVVAMVVRTAMHSESVMLQGYLAQACISRSRIRPSLNQFKFRTTEY